MNTRLGNIHGVLSEYIEDDILDECMEITGGDIISLLKQHIGPIFVMGVDGKCVILSFKKGMVRIHIDCANDVKLRRRAKLLDKEIGIDSLYRILLAIETLRFIVANKENRNHANLH